MCASAKAGWAAVALGRRCETSDGGERRRRCDGEEEEGDSAKHIVISRMATVTDRQTAMMPTQCTPIMAA